MGPYTRLYQPKRPPHWAKRVILLAVLVALYVGIGVLLAWRG